MNHLYIFEDDVLDEESVSDECYSGDEKEINLFIAQGELCDEHVVEDEEEEVEAEVHLEGQLVSALEEL